MRKVVSWKFLSRVYNQHYIFYFSILSTVLPLVLCGHLCSKFDLLWSPKLKIFCWVLINALINWEVWVLFILFNKEWVAAFFLRLARAMCARTESHCVCVFFTVLKIILMMWFNCVPIDSFFFYCECFLSKLVHSTLLHYTQYYGWDI